MSQRKNETHEEWLARQRAQYAAHREEHCARNKAYCAAHRDERRAYGWAYEAAHREKRKAYRAAHPDENNARQRAYYAAHHEECRARCKAYRAAHCKEHCAHEKKRRALKRQTRQVAANAVLTHDQWEHIQRLSKGRCYWCNKKMQEVTQDHVVPLSKGGLHTAENVVASCRSCNSKKGVKIVTLF